MGTSEGITRSFLNFISEIVDFVLLLFPYLARISCFHLPEEHFHTGTELNSLYECS